MLEIGSVVDGKYKILHLVGKGGMSMVYLALNERANKQWAIKEVRKDGRYDYDVVRQNLIVEMEILKQLRHPYLPAIVDVIDCDDTFLIVMDYIEGRPLNVVLQEQGVQSQGDVIRWAKQICEVLYYLHSREPPVIYRDMKPANVMLRPDGNITVIDFGTAREYDPSHLEDTVRLGTRGYAAPEQYGGRGQTDARTDIYCLGATLYHLLTGHDPSRPPYEMVPLRQWDAGLSAGLEQIISKCTKANPEDRYQNCKELLFALDNYEKLDSNYKRGLVGRLKLFAAAVFMTVLTGLIAITAGVHAGSLKARNYQEILLKADQAGQVEELKDVIRSAVSLDRSNPEAARRMLDWITADNTFSEEEKTAIESILYTPWQGVQYISSMKKHRRDYEEFSYQMGLAYFFYYKGSRGKDIARTWFKELEDSGIDLKKRARARVYARIGTYYMSLGTTDKSGEKTDNNSSNYQQLFNDLVELNNYNPEDLGPSQAAITLYNEIAIQIGRNAASLGNVISEQQLTGELDRIQLRINGLSREDPESVLSLKRNVRDARASIAAVSRYMDRLAKETVHD
ncbi:MAG: serine/threonine protein kinase [Eubacterium sp.]|nr:serine/threonine protein kinase [Eubacterium sp.]